MAPQVVHECNHTIETRQIVNDTLNVVRTPGRASDQIRSGISVFHVESVFQESESETTFYYNGADFQRMGANLIQWLEGGAAPDDGTTYQVECAYSRIDIQEHAAEDCPRCFSNGWYVDLFPQERTEVTKLKGISKIVQDIIKIIFTYRVEGNYGTRLVDYVGVPMNQPEQVMAEVTSIISGAAMRYRQLQAEALASGVKLTRDELLDRLLIQSVRFDEMNSGILIDAVVYNQSGVSRPIRLGA